MKARDLIDIIEELAPPDMACDWDNTGFQVGRRDTDITGVYVALDATERSIRAATKAGCNFLLTHHPLIFKGVKSISDDSSVGRRLLMMAEAGIVYYAAHTSYDAAPGMMADRIAARLGLSDTLPIEPSQNGGSIGRIGRLSEPLYPEELSQRVKAALSIPYVIEYSPDGLTKKQITCVGVLPGSGRDELALAQHLGAEAYVTGDINYHTAVDAMEDGMIVIDAGHYGTEWAFIEDMEAELRKRLPKHIPVMGEEFHFPGKIR
ncbi:MAG: Nif3-like dinuclear metal center hexameric protein [Lachnospiraceae bacterium]|nr:Nif3-like dinuclear metal center hexameric protein [Lachnospiraceae bacterium]